MSHTVKIKTQFKEFSILQRTLEEMGWTIESNSAARAYSGDPNRDRVFPFVAVNPDTTQNSYDIGIVPTQNELEVYGDFYGGSLAKHFGIGLAKLKTAYALNVIKDEYEQYGYTVDCSKNENGSLIVEVYK